MSARALSHVTVAIGLASLLGATAAAADSKAFRFTYPEASAQGDVVLGPGAARGISIKFVPEDPAPEGEVPAFEIAGVTFLAQNAPGCDTPKAEGKGSLAFVDWGADCALPSSSVDLCIRANLPITFVGANFVDQYGAFLAEAVVTSLPDAACDALDCSGAVATAEGLVPPNHRLVPVTITGIIGVAPITIETKTITHDEALNARADGNTCPDGAIVDGAPWVRSERSGRGNGRVYVVTFAATDATGATCNGQVEVCVPHDLRHECVDDGQTVNALDQCPLDEAQLSLEASVHVEASGGRARMSFALPSAAKVDVGVFDVAGRRVAEVESGMRSAGTHELSWDVSGLAHGVYFVRMRAGDVSVSKTLLVSD